MAADWSSEEIEVTVAEYFAMLRAEIAGVPYKKSVHNERARRLLNNRSKASVEFKFQNISAVLVNHSQLYVRGYLPRQNYQAALETSVLEWLAGTNDLAEALDVRALVDPPSPAGARSFADILVDPPEPRRAARPSGQVAPVKIDFLRLDAENRKLGVRGEEFVYELEKRRLHDEANRRDLSKRIRWVSRDDGDGLGYDIASFDASGAPRLIEVKTTAAGKYFPFTLSQNELAVSKRELQRYHLYRVHEFGPDPRLYVLQGALDESCVLTPVQFRASFGPASHSPRPRA